MCYCMRATYQGNISYMIAELYKNIYLSLMHVYILSLRHTYIHTQKLACSCMAHLYYMKLDQISPRPAPLLFPWTSVKLAGRTYYKLICKLCIFFRNKATFLFYWKRNSAIYELNLSRLVTLFRYSNKLVRLRMVNPIVFF